MLLFFYSAKIHQIFRCEGTADYHYTDSVSTDYQHGVETDQSHQQVVDKLPEEMPFPTPFVGELNESYLDFVPSIFLFSKEDIF